MNLGNAFRASLMPFWTEWVVLLFISGLLLSQLTEPQDRHGLGLVKVVIIAVCWLAVLVHLIALAFDNDTWPVLMHIRNQLGGFSFLCCCIQVYRNGFMKWTCTEKNCFHQILDFLSFHYLFGPWAIIISSLIVDTMKFFVILMLFEGGFSMLVISMNQPYNVQNGISQSEEKEAAIIRTSHGII